MPRANSELLLVGSLPAESSEEAMRAAASFFGGLVFALPDGETGPRSGWVRYERSTLTGPDIEPVPGHEGSPGGPRHIYEVRRERIRQGVTRLRWDRWPRVDDAIASYQLFARLRAEGLIPAGLRFQVGLPMPFSALGARFLDPADYAIAEEAYLELAARELDRLTEAIPCQDLAIQWDIANEILDVEGVLPYTRHDRDGAWQRFARPLERLAPCVPEDVLMGVHLCYGTFPEWPMYEARDMSLLVQAANFAVARAGRPVDWLHLAGPRYLRSEEDDFYRPLERLCPGDARVYLGIVLPIDGLAGLRRRAATAARYWRDFGVAMYCGFGRQPGANGTETMREHARVVREHQGTQR